jgi:hypothetical protein
MGALLFLPKYKYLERGNTCLSKIMPSIFETDVHFKKKK